MCLCLCEEIKLWLQRTVILSAKYSMRATLHFYYGLMPKIFSLSLSLSLSVSLPLLAEEVLKRESLRANEATFVLILAGG